jgi:hypothetical protein
MQNEENRIVISLQGYCLKKAQPGQEFDVFCNLNDLGDEIIEHDLFCNQADGEDSTSINSLSTNDASNTENLMKVKKNEYFSVVMDCFHETPAIL